MPNLLASFPDPDDQPSAYLSRRQRRAMAENHGETEVFKYGVANEVDRRAAIVDGRYYLAGHAAQTDAMAEAFLTALPVFSESSLLFRAQLLQGARIGTLNDVMGFRS